MCSGVLRVVHMERIVIRDLERHLRFKLFDKLPMRGGV